MPQRSVVPIRMTSRRLVNGIQVAIWRQDTKCNAAGHINQDLTLCFAVLIWLRNGMEGVC